MGKLPGTTKNALQKARDSAVLAVEVYNKPAVAFKSGAYITLMVIAWTSLFHAIFYHRKQKPYYRKTNGRYVRIDGEYRHWELDECLKHYYGHDTMNPVRKNLELFIPLRNKIEHRLFSYISINWRGKPLTSLETIIELLSHTTTTEGLTVTAVVDQNTYPIGVKVSDEEMAQLNILRDAFHGEWNYTIRPQENT